MTNREFFTAVSTSSVNDEIKAFALDAIAKLDARNEKRASTPSKTAVANEPIKVAILAYVGEHANAIAVDIATACEISTQKASALCVQLVNEGKLTANEVKVAKKGKVKGYTLAVEG